MAQRVVSLEHGHLGLDSSETSDSPKHVDFYLRGLELYKHTYAFIWGGLRLHTSVSTYRKRSSFRRV